MLEAMDGLDYTEGTSLCDGAEMRYSATAAMYSSQVLDHFEHPRNGGDLADTDAHVRVENPACGDILELSARMEDGRILEMRFRARGCVPAMACGSLITEMVKGKTFAEAKAIRKEAIAQGIGGLPEASGHAAQLAYDALRALLEQTTPNV
jgi:nitrogen fixation protein NifU and related proteins